MERESFESQEIADILNKSFVPIKVDREERPDIDAIYMNYVQVGHPNLYLSLSSSDFDILKTLLASDRLARPFTPISWSGIVLQN